MKDSIYVILIAGLAITNFILMSSNSTCLEKVNELEERIETIDYTTKELYRKINVDNIYEIEDYSAYADSLKCCID